MSWDLKNNNQKQYLKSMKGFYLYFVVYARLGVPSRHSSEHWTDGLSSTLTIKKRPLRCLQTRKRSSLHQSARDCVCRRFHALKHRLRRHFWRAQRRWAKGKGNTRWSIARKWGGADPEFLPLPFSPHPFPTPPPIRKRVLLVFFHVAWCSSTVQL